MPSSRKTIVALNGFLGRTSDWPQDLAPDGWAFKAWPLEEINDFETWAEHFCQHVEEQIKGDRVLLGYSMGGRLAAHALIKKPSLFNGALFVSANPGLTNDEDRRLRVMTDDLWAKKFLSDPWPQLMDEWNGQVALRPPKNPGPDYAALERPESDYSRAQLAQTLRYFSLGLQRDLRSELRALKVPFEFVTGEDDLKFTSLTKAFAHESGRPHTVVAQAGHRVPWDAPTQLRAILARFLRTV